MQYRVCLVMLNFYAGKSAPAGITQNDENICTLCSNPLQFYMLDDQVQAYCGECCFYEKNGPSMHASSSNNAGVDNARTPLYGSSSFDHDFLLAKGTVYICLK